MMARRVCWRAALAKEFSPDIVLLEGMPGIDGCETCRRLRSVDQSADIVAVTGWGQPRDHDRAISQVSTRTCQRRTPARPRKDPGVNAGPKSDRSTRGRASVRRDLLTRPAATAGRLGILRGVQGLPELGVLPQAVAVAPNHHQVAASATHASSSTTRMGSQAAGCNQERGRVAAQAQSRGEIAQDGQQRAGRAERAAEEGG